MSYSIEYNRKMFTCPSAEGKPPSYLLLVKSGDNNVYTRDGVRARDWRVAFSGKEAEFWPFIGCSGGYC